MTIKNKRKKRIYTVDLKNIPKGFSVEKFIEEWKNHGMHRNIMNTYYYDNKKYKEAHV